MIKSCYDLGMKLIVGLGNPGDKYKNNRHNVGFMVLDELVQMLMVKGESDGLNFELKSKFDAEIIQSNNYVLAKPITYMNDSGKAVAAISRFYKVKSEDIYIVHDDLDIPLGSYKIQHGKAPKVHNGLLSVEQSLGTNKYWNVRVGVENREVRGNKGIPGVVYSLQDCTELESPMVSEVVEKVVLDLHDRILQGYTS